jgi:hypothetical protein
LGVARRQGGLFNYNLSRSLKIIQAAKKQLLKAHGSTPNALMSKIALCDLLLEELRAISSSLERRMSSASAIRRRPATLRRTRNGKRRPASQNRRRLNSAN